MPRLHVCPLALIDNVVETTQAGSLVTLLSPGTRVTRPAAIDADRHLNLAISDITTPLPGHVLPENVHVRRLIEFVGAWDRARPMVIHCFAGVSRSTAAAFITVCALAPHREETAIAASLRAASPTATPNARLVALADSLLGRKGRMSAAIEAIGRGGECSEGRPFALEIG
jgi:predicted protein tyrosine phosphatase